VVPKEGKVRLEELTVKRGGESFFKQAGEKKKSCASTKKTAKRCWSRFARGGRVGQKGESLAD